MPDNGEIKDPAIYPSLNGRSVFITGGGSGIGAALVTHFVRQGARVTFVDIAKEPSEKLLEELGQSTSPPHFIQCDLRDTDQLEQAIKATAQRQGPIRVLVNNAGNDDRHHTGNITAKYWDERMEVNLRHQFFAAQAAREQMVEAGGGSIINFSSITWLVGDGDCPAYVTAKAAIIGLTRALARELGPQNIRVNSVLPGWVMTKRQIDLWLDQEGERQIAERQCLSGRLYPPDIARMVLFLAADDSRMCTSQSYIVDGGWV